VTRSVVRSIAGPVLRAGAEGSFHLREAVRVGADALLGEVVRLDGDEIVVQVYEDTTGLRPGSEVHGDGRPLAARLGPALLGRIFDGLLRPLSGAPHRLAPGMRSAAPERFAFVPRIAPGARISGGESIGEALAPGGRMARVLAAPDVAGEVVSVVAAGDYPDDAPLVSVRRSASTASSALASNPRCSPTAASWRAHGTRWCSRSAARSRRS